MPIRFGVSLYANKITGLGSPYKTDNRYFEDIFKWHLILNFKNRAYLIFVFVSPVPISALLVNRHLISTWFSRVTDRQQRMWVNCSPGNFLAVLSLGKSLRLSSLISL